MIDFRDWFAPSQGAQIAPRPVAPAIQFSDEEYAHTEVERAPEFDDLQPDFHEKVPMYGPPPQPRNEPPATGIESFERSDLAALQVELSFPCHSVLVDNFTNQWLYFPSANRHVAPYTFGAVLPLIRASQVASYVLTAPPTFTQAATVTGQKISTTWFGVMLGYDPGVSASPFANKGAKTTLAVVSVTNSAGGTLVLAANPNRKSAFFQNLGANLIALGKDNTVTTGTGIQLTASLSPPASFNDTSSVDAWQAIAATGATNLLVLEVS